MRDQVPLLDDIINYQRQLIDELKHIISDKNEILDHMNVEIGYLKQMLSAKSPVEQQE